MVIGLSLFASFLLSSSLLSSPLFSSARLSSPNPYPFSSPFFLSLSLPFTWFFFFSFSLASSCVTAGITVTDKARCLSWAQRSYLLKTLTWRKPASSDTSLPSSLCIKPSIILNTAPPVVCMILARKIGLRWQYVPTMLLNRWRP